MRWVGVGKLGSIAVVLLAALAIAAPAALALPTFNAASYPAKIQAQTLEDHIFGFNASWKCKQASLGATFTEASSTLTLVPEYSECTFFGLPVKATNTGCSYEIHLKEELKADEFKGTLDIRCAKGALLEFTWISNLCRWTIGEQTALTTVRVQNRTTAEPAPDMLLWFEVQNIKYTEEGSAAQCTGKGTFTNGKYSGVALLGALNPGSEPIAFWAE